MSETEKALYDSLVRCVMKLSQLRANGHFVPDDPSADPCEIPERLIEEGRAALRRARGEK